MKKLKVAVIQLAAGPHKHLNLKTALKLVRNAIRQGAHFILLPETFNFRGKENEAIRNAEGIPGPSTRIFMSLARQERVWILIGSLGEKISRSKKAYNTSILIDPRGKKIALYRKIHLFDAALKNKKIKESQHCKSGKRPVIAKVEGIKVGLSICYDLRFPDMYRTYSKGGAKILCVPSNFTAATGKAHWEVLLRARAIENQCFVLAPNQCGIGGRRVKAYGNSMIIDPWGRVLARAKGRGNKILLAVLDMDKLNSIRKTLPSLKHAEFQGHYA
jgi:deaminated glutathione amidase